MEMLTFGEQVALASGASAIAGLHGAGLANLMFMKPCGIVLELRQMTGVPNFFFTLAAACRQSYYYLSCTPADPNMPTHAVDVVCDASELAAALAEIGERL
jgi:capsular polysaccharide biosynthesis protein